MTEKRLKRLIELGDEENILTGAREYVTKVHRDNFYLEQRTTYDLLFPTFREMTEQEKYTFDFDNNQAWDGRQAFQAGGVIPYHLISIDYSENESFITYEEYRDETKVSTPAVEAVGEVRELVRPYVGLSKEDVDAQVAAYLAKSEVYKSNQIDKFQKLVDTFMSDYPQYERDSFIVQETEAKAFMNDVNAVTPFLDALANSRGVDKTFLAKKIIEKANIFKTTIGSLLGQKQKEVG